MEPNALPVFASDNLACVSGTPSLVLLILKTLRLGLVGMRRPPFVLLAVASVLVDWQGLSLLSKLALGPPLRPSLRLLHLLLRGGPLLLVFGPFVPTNLGVGGRVRIGRG